MSEPSPQSGEPDSPTPPVTGAAAALPERVGEYGVERLLGEGGMGRVYLCRDDALDRLVAVKVLHENVAAEKDMTERFLREARAMAKVSSPHVVTVFHVVQKDGVPPHIVMEVLEGEDVSSRIHKHGPLPWPEAVDVILGAVKGLAAALKVGIVHRDVKPANLFLTPHGTKLTDFGLARPIDGSADLTSAGIIVGTPHYLAPELARGGSGDVSSDIYALGATLFRMLTGKPPFDDEAALAVITKHIIEPPPLASSHGASVPKELDELIVRMMAKQVEDRPRGYEELEALLLAVRQGAPLSSTSTMTAVSGSGVPVMPDGPTKVSGVGSVAGASGSAATKVTPHEELAQKLRPVLAAKGPLPMVAAIGAGVVVVIGLGLAVGGDDSDLERIDEGDAAKVLAEIEQEPPRERPGDRELNRGHALDKLERYTEAIAAYGEAAKKGASDERALNVLISLLDNRKADDLIEVLKIWPDDDVNGRLRKLLKGGTWFEQHHAAVALKGRGKLSRAEEEALGIKDLLEADSCDRRRHGLLRLRRVGESDEAYAAVQRASRRMPDNLCMALDFPAALRALKKNDDER